MHAADLSDLLARPPVHGQAVALHDEVIEGDLDLSGLILGGFDLRGCHFSGDVAARGARFAGLGWFGGSTFAGALDLSFSRFLNDARFENCVFDGPVTVTGAEFHGIACFDSARLARLALFDKLTCYGNLSLDRAQFDRGADFTGSECLGGFWGNQTQFGAESDFSETQVHGRLWLRGAREGNAALRPGRFGLSFGYAYT